MSRATYYRAVVDGCDCEAYAGPHYSVTWTHGDGSMIEGARQPQCYPDESEILRAAESGGYRDAFLDDYAVMAYRVMI